MLRPKVALFVLASAIVPAAFACFPGYQVGSSSGDDGGGGGTDGSGSSSGGSSGSGSGGSSGSGSGSSSGGSSGGGSGSSSGGGSGGDGGVFDSSTQALVPRGSFTFIDPSGQAKTLEAFSHDVLFDKYEVTVEEFDAWINAGKPIPADYQSLDPGGPYADIYWRPEWDAEASTLGYNDTTNCTNAQAMESTEFDVNGPTYAMYLANKTATAKYPINCVNWYQAVAYCWYAGHKRLATEAEYQYEITGLTRGFTYPWGNAPTPTDCTYAIWRGTDGGSLNKWNGCGFPKPIGSAPAGRSFDGVLDMQGSVEEWIWNRPNNEYPAQWPNDYAGPPNDAGPDPQRTARGGSWFTDAPEMDGKKYDNLGPTAIYTDLGIRCVQTKL